MIRSAAGKVMWVGRATVFLVGLAMILALVFGVATSAMGANGKPFLLGKRNVASAVSVLVKQGPGPALRLAVGAGQPPLSVNASAGKATNLNADKLDNLDSGAFQRANAAAGGDLSGNYPNPEIAAGGVGPAEVADGQLDLPDVAEYAGTFWTDRHPISASSCESFNLPTQGLGDGGDFVVVNPPSTLEVGLVPFTTGMPPGGTYLPVRLCNVTGAAIDPAEATWRYAIFDDGNDGDS